MLQFNTAGPSVAKDHYRIDPLSRINLQEITSLIESNRYFVLHAPRQTGKTTCLIALMKHINAEGKYRAVYANIETAQTARNNVEEGMRAIVGEVAEAIHRATGDDKPAHEWIDIFKNFGPQAALKMILNRWTQSDPSHTTLLFLDEVDALVGDTLISLLRQLRSGYADRPENFPQSVILCGVRDVRDYRIHTGNGEIITGGSAFNVKAASLRLGNFTQDEIKELFEQHTKETGQKFAEEIYPYLWEDTAGQPWLVNALGQELCFELKGTRDRSTTLDLELYRQARERLIQSRATHLDQLADKLQEPRVHRVISWILSDNEQSETIPTDDMQYVEDMGLITLNRQIRISNGIYQEIIPRELTWTRQLTMVQKTAWYQRSDRRIDTKKLLRAFQQFFRENADSWIEQFQYKEAGPQLLLMAFLQRIINGGGRISREYGLGRKRMDLYLEWPLDETLGFRGEMQRVVLELKLQRKTLEATLAEGLPQTSDYAAHCGADEAHLIIFDRTGEKGWDEKIWEQVEQVEGKEIRVWGM